ncbi:helix-turn-helix domain-containing protein [uncultured Clostridium sp.]|jgi:transcriptional regulator with XRE-family HTH domain|uniref:helix-turn-helix domain-containing protein n=1 Tax=uncultured Clostridium sp. TaxID=59620 RepID=UPI00280B2E64|nr:helix-turn-helix domain-containing protein [uncultured Clostridium sp.]
MTINSRIKKIRKELKLTQAAFGERIGLKQAAIGLYENGLRNVLDRVIFDICREFNVNEEWLRNGTGEMFVESDTFSLDDYVKQKGATDLELDIIKTWFEIPEEYRSYILNHFKTKILPALQKDSEICATKAIKNNDDNMDHIKYEVEAYTAELIAEKKGAIYSASEDSEECSDVKKDLA